MKKLLWLIFEEVTLQKEPLMKEFDKLKVNYEVFTAQLFSFEEGKLLYEGKELTHLPNLVLLRCGIGIEEQMHDYFWERNIRVIDNAVCHHNCDDKYNFHMLMEDNNIAQPRTLFFDMKVSYRQIAKILGPKFVIKDRFGQQGQGVFLVNNEKEFSDVYSKFEIGHLFFQEFVAESSGKDLRTYIVGDEVIGAILRVSENDFRSNISLGAKPVAYELSKEQIENSIKIAKVLNGEIISVDFLIKNNGELLFCEANTNAGIASFIQSGFPIAEKIAAYVYGIFEGIDF
ncbi:MAG: RimK family alpha-L-glutamate ligase [Firmicutes bacterium]|nr:RimK family alpha-L-glutamate ligase [Bacillota bacterium]MCL2770725.1 RimK family alpha-L-glutamate ligase [Bacillota bacterium]